MPSRGGECASDVRPEVWVSTESGRISEGSAFPRNLQGSPQRGLADRVDAPSERAKGSEPSMSPSLRRIGAALGVAGALAAAAIGCGGSTEGTASATQTGSQQTQPPGRPVRAGRDELTCPPPPPLPPSRAHAPAPCAPSSAAAPRTRHGSARALRRPRRRGAAVPLEPDDQRLLQRVLRRRRQGGERELEGVVLRLPRSGELHHRRQAAALAVAHGHLRARPRLLELRDPAPAGALHDRRGRRPLRDRPARHGAAGRAHRGRRAGDHAGHRRDRALQQPGLRCSQRRSRLDGRRRSPPRTCWPGRRRCSRA